MESTKGCCSLSGRGKLANCRAINVTYEGHRSIEHSTHLIIIFKNQKTQGETNGKRNNSSCNVNCQISMITLLKQLLHLKHDILHNRFNEYHISITLHCLSMILQ